MHPRVLVIVLGVCLGIINSSKAETPPEQADSRLELARTLYQTAIITHLKADYLKAFNTFLPLAEEGNPEAQETIGRMYGIGIGVDVDRCQATYWLDKAARSGRPWAQHLMGGAYWNGNGVIRDHDLAYLWFMTAAKNGRERAAKDASILAQSDLRAPGRVAALDEQLRRWRPEDQPPARIIRMPNIWGINWLMRISGLTPCHFAR